MLYSLDFLWGFFWVLAGVFCCCSFVLFCLFGWVFLLRMCSFEEHPRMSIQIPRWKRTPSPTSTVHSQQVRPAAVRKGPVLWLVSPSTAPLLRVGLPPNHAMGDRRQEQTSTLPLAALQQGLERDQGSQGKGQEATDRSQHVRNFC